MISLSDIKDGDILNNLEMLKDNEFYDSPQYRVEKYTGFYLVPTNNTGKRLDAEVAIKIAKHPYEKYSGE